jgi:hypothetical protein
LYLGYLLPPVVFYISSIGCWLHCLSVVLQAVDSACVRLNAGEVEIFASCRTGGLETDECQLHQSWNMFLNGRAFAVLTDRAGEVLIGCADKILMLEWFCLQYFSFLLSLILVVLINR